MVEVTTERFLAYNTVDTVLIMTIKLLSAGRTELNSVTLDEQAPARLYSRDLLPDALTKQ